MIIEKLVGPKNLPKYRAWKGGVRRELANRRASAGQMLNEFSLARAFDAAYTPIFVCGLSGSGTTLLSALLEQNYENELALRESDRHPKADHLLWLDKTESYESLAAYRDAIILAEHVGQNRVRRAKLRLYRRLTDYPRRSLFVLDKAPNSHLVRIEKLMRAFPNGQALLIFRDPVEVIEGLQRKWPVPFGRASIEELGHFWVEMHRQFLGQVSFVDQRPLIFSYEDMVDQSEVLLSTIAEAFGLKRRRAPIELKDKKNKAGKGLRNVVDGKIKIVKNAGAESRQRMDKENARLVETICGAMLAELQAARSLGQ